jgi:hypothetical protein
MPVVSGDSMGFSGLMWTCKLSPSSHMETSIWHARPFDSTF